MNPTSTMAINYKTGKQPHPKEHRMIFRNVDREGWDTSIDCYLREGGYEQLRKALTMEPKAITEEVKLSGLRGRGGAGFPTGVKWTFIPPNNTKPVYLICNADESEPGTFKDRYIIHQDPHQLIEGMTISCFAVGAHLAYIYIREEFPEGAQILEKAIAEARARGFLGKNICGSGFDLEIYVHRGAGAYICGEETALLSSIEGQRPEVRVRPPFPTVQGLFRKPTIVSNVETFANLHAILTLGGKAYGSIGTAQSTGPKLLSLDSHFVRPGIYEAPMGLPLKDVFAAAGGFRKPVKAIHIGGPLGGLIPLALTDSLTVDFESFKSAGFLLGHAGVIAIPEAMPMIDYLEHLFQFTADESCGKCFPCRLGSTRGRELIAKARNDASFRIDPELIGDLLDTMEQTSLCALGGGVPLPVRNALRYFRSELQPFFTAPLP
jgi:NADH-quinone oxidoreductase subunit F